MANYCMKCGTPNLPGSRFCSQCGKKFGAEDVPKTKENSKDSFPQPGPKPNPVKDKKQPEEGDSSVMSKKGRSYSNTSRPISNLDDIEDEIIDEEEDINDSKENDLDYVPDIGGLSIEPIAPPPKAGETWAAMVAQAEADKQRRGIQ